jgi:hypothetical protein
MTELDRKIGALLFLCRVQAKDIADGKSATPLTRSDAFLALEHYMETSTRKEQQDEPT